MIHGIAGSIGSGKSLLQLKIALEMSNFKEKQLVCNFPLNRKALNQYAIHMKYKWILKLLKYGGISEMHAPESLEELFLPESIVCLDEAGIFLNAREFQKTSKKLLADLCQSRKFGTDLVWCSQFLEQVDNQFRMLTQYWTQANSLTIYDKKMRRPKLWYKRYYWMDSATYYAWNQSTKAKMSHFRTRFAYSYRYEGGILTKGDRLLFNCFDSFSRLDAIASSAKIESMFTCPLHVPQARSVSEFRSVPPDRLDLVPNFSALSDYRSKNPDKFPEYTNQILDDLQLTTEEEDNQLILDLYPDTETLRYKNNVLYIPDRMKGKSA
jgi:hypothetical protein